QASPPIARSSAPALPAGGGGCRLVRQTVQYRAPITRRTRYRSREATSTNGKRPPLIGVTVRRARQISARRCNHAPVVRAPFCHKTPDQRDPPQTGGYNVLNRAYSDSSLSIDLICSRTSGVFSCP